MLTSAARVLAAVIALSTMSGVLAQPLLTPTPPPTVTAENDSWFQSREPLVFSGRLYYPAGAQVHFNRNEMVRMGYYGAVPIYTRTTIEPYSIIFVPLAGGVMQPYERRRSGDLAGTAGSTAPSFPITSPSQLPDATAPEMIQAQSPPTGLVAVDRDVRALAAIEQPAASLDRAVATTGYTREVPMGPQQPVSLSAQKPEGLNGIFITFKDQRWFSRGPAVMLETSRLTPAGTYNGLPVYADPSAPNTVYVPVSASALSLVAPYTRDERRQSPR
jgi:hypothetical protein